MGAFFAAFTVPASDATYANPGDVRDGVDRGDGTPGTLAVPEVADVRQGVQYGAGGVELTGTLVASVMGGEVEGSGDEIKRRIELYVVGILRGLLAGWTIVPSKGGDDEEDAQEVEPPFVLVKVTGCEQVLDDPPTHQVALKVAYFAHMSETTSPAYSGKVGELQAALRVLPRGYYASTDLTINGVSVEKPDEIRDDEQKIAADVFEMAMGVTEGRVG